jgi:hypothetical protein
MSAPNTSQASSVLLQIEDDFERCRATDIAVYAPSSFRRATNLLGELHQEWPGLAGDRLEERVSRAREALQHADSVAQATRPHLWPLVGLRAQAVRDSALGSRAPDELRTAEDCYWAAVERAEAHDFDAADERAHAGVRAYRAASAASLERGALLQHARDIEEGRGILGHDDYDEAQAELKRLRSDLKTATSGELPLAELRSRIADRATWLQRQTQPPAGHGGGGGSPTDGLQIHIDPGSPLAPGTREPPPAVDRMRIGERQANALTVHWRDSATGFITSQVLERSVGDAPFVAIAEPPRSSTGWSSWVDSGLDPDTRYTYRVRTLNDNGYSVTLRANMAVGYTRNAEDLPVWRIQLYVRVADVSDAGTDDRDFLVALQSASANYGPNGNRLWLDHGPRLINVWPPRWQDDLTRASEFTYDLSLDHVSQLADITEITMIKRGEDAAAIAEIALQVNGREVFRKHFGESASTCLWLGEGGGHEPYFTIGHAELRASPSWQGYPGQPPDPPYRFENDELVSRFEAIVGDSIHETAAHWRYATRQVRVTTSVEGEQAQQIFVRLLLHADSGHLIVPDPDITLTFTVQLSITCNSTNTEATVGLVAQDVDSNASYGALINLFALALAPAGPAVLAYLTTLANRAAKAGFQPVAEHIVLNSNGRCPSLSVDADVDGNASIRFRPF